MVHALSCLTGVASASTELGAGLTAPQKIEFWTFSMKPKFTPYFEQLVKRYERDNPAVKVEWIDFPWDIIQTKLVTRIVAGTPPALVNLNVPWADEFARDGLLTPVDGLLGDARARYLPGTLQDLTFGGKTYGFPMYSNVAVITYNTQIFKQAGLTHAPRDLDEQLLFARQIAAVQGSPMVVNLFGAIPFTDAMIVRYIDDRMRSRVTGVRLAIGIIWIVLVPAEMLGVSAGLGYFILDTRDRLAYSELMAAVVLIGALGYALDHAARWLHQRWMHSA